MAGAYDVIVIGSGLGGLTAATLLARAGRKTLLIERNYGVGGAASTYKSGDLIIEASLHETSDPRHPIDPKHHILARAGVLDEVDWVPTGAIYEVRGGPVGAPFVLPEGFGAAREALIQRFPSAGSGIRSVLGDMERVTVALGTLSSGRQAFRDPTAGVSALAKLGPLVRGWQHSLSDRFSRAFGADEGVKCALAANLAYWHDDPRQLSWPLFAVAQGGYLASGGRYIRGGSQRLSNALARALKAAGGEILLRRAVTEIIFDDRGRLSGVAHERRDGGERTLVHAPKIIANAAPAVLAPMLPEHIRARFWTPYATRPLSISLFAATFGLSVPPAELGFRAYSTILLPSWMKGLGDYRRTSDLMAGLPGSDAPVLTIVDYSSIESGISGAPYPVSVVGVDKVGHWTGLDGSAYDDKRERWRQAILAAIDAEFPGFASSVTDSVFSTAATMRNYLNAPDGAVYGFAPMPMTTPIWKGPGSSPKTAVPGLFLGSSYGGLGGFTGAILAGGRAADLVLADDGRFLT